jgi:eukaryotic-like serine/threonine-protein kinase
MTNEAFARTRTLSFRAPIANEEERGQFQRRLALLLLLTFSLAGLHWVVTALSVLVIAPEHLFELWAKADAQVQLAMISLGLLVWALLRRGAPSKGKLDAVDVVNTIAGGVGWMAMTLFVPTRERPELIGLLICTLTLFMRSALIPSTPARTALLSAVSLLPLLVATQLRGRAPTSSPLSPAIYAMIWALLAIGATTTTTVVIYGLRLQVRKAMQLGQYVLGDKLGQGGMGEVFRASHALLRREAAIKLLTESDGQAIARFEREVQITARLTHPNTVSVFDYGRTPDGVFYYAMEYLEGVSLQDLVDQTGPQPPQRVVHFLLQVCGALREAHGAGLVHRDIKPANLMLTARGGIPDFVKVLDFGLVKEMVTPEGAARTHADALLGTPHFMAPESILEPQRVDGRADLYALGATAFFLLTGEHVFAGNSVVEVCSKHLHAAPVAPSSKRPGIPGSLDAIVLACLAKEPNLRPSDATALARLLRQAEAGAWTEDDAAAWWENHPAPLRRERKEATKGATVSATLPVDLAGRLAGATMQGPPLG